MKPNLQYRTLSGGHRRLSSLANIIFSLAALTCPLAASVLQAQGVTADTILIGQSAALSGPAAELGRAKETRRRSLF